MAAHLSDHIDYYPITISSVKHCSLRIDNRSIAEAFIEQTPSKCCGCDCDCDSCYPCFPCCITPRDWMTQKNGTTVFVARQITLMIEMPPWGAKQKLEIYIPPLTQLSLIRDWLAAVQTFSVGSPGTQDME